MISAPDSSLNILERIDPATLTNMADEALYSLLYTQARDKNYIIQVEEYVNKYRGNIMALLRQELPMFSPMDYRFLCFFYAGFSAKAISVFTNDSINNIYVRRYRYKEKILSLNPPHTDLFIENL